MERHSSLEASLIAGLAASSAIQPPISTVLDAECGPGPRAIPLRQFVVLLSTRVIGLFAPGADPFAQALGEHSQHGVGKVERVAPEIQQTGHGFDCSVRMEGTQHQVACEGSLNGDVGCFLVSHFADHDDVGIGTQKGTHRGREGEADLRMDLDLTEAILGYFNGVFRRPNLSFVGIDLLENGMQVVVLPDPVGPTHKIIPYGFSAMV